MEAGFQNWLKFSGSQDLNSFRQHLPDAGIPQFRAKSAVVTDAVTMFLESFWQSACPARANRLN
jgi:hypothetical protein